MIDSLQSYMNAFVRIHRLELCRTVINSEAEEELQQLLNIINERLSERCVIFASVLRLCTILCRWRKLDELCTRSVGIAQWLKSAVITE